LPVYQHPWGNFSHSAISTVLDRENPGITSSGKSGTFALKVLSTNIGFEVGDDVTVDDLLPKIGVTSVAARAKATTKRIIGTLLLGKAVIVTHSVWLVKLEKRS
jgi:hypothetical protein